MKGCQKKRRGERGSRKGGQTPLSHKKFRNALERKGIIQFFNYPRRPQMNAQIESLNRTIQEEFIDWNLDLLSIGIDAFNQKLVDWLLWYDMIPKELTLP